MIAAIVPALNEQETVAEVVRRVRTFVDVVIVIDDGSTDATSSRAADAGAVVIAHSVNQGVGAAIATGLRAAAELGATAVLQVDGDGQHDAESIPVLLSRFDDGADVVVGTRFELGFEMGRTRRVVLGIFGRMISARVGVRISDPTSGFRVFSRRAVAELAPIFPTKYLSDTVEVLYLAHERGLSIVAAPVRMHPRRVGSSSVGVWTGGMYTLRMVGIVLGHTLRRGRR